MAHDHDEKDPWEEFERYRKLKGAFRVLKDEAILEKLLLKDSSVEKVQTESDGDMTPLHLACQMGNEAAVKVLLQKFNTSADILKSSGDNENTGIHFASASGSLPTLRLLMEKLTGNPSVDVHNKYKRTPLHVALEGGMVGTARLLISLGARIDARDQYNFALIHFAAASGRTEALDLVKEVTVNLDVNMASSRGLTALHWAAGNGKTVCVEWLLAEGADMTQTDSDGLLPLHFAASYGRLNVVEQLMLKGGTDPLAKNKRGDHVLKIIRDRNKSLLPKLVDQMMQVKDMEFSYEMARYVAMFGSVETVEALVTKLLLPYRARARVELVKRAGLLENAASEGNKDALRPLVRLLRQLEKENIDILSHIHCALTKALLEGEEGFADDLMGEMNAQEMVKGLGSWVPEIRKKLGTITTDSTRDLSQLWVGNIEPPFAFLLFWRKLEGKSVATCTSQVIERHGLWSEIGFSGKIENLGSSTTMNAFHWAVLLLRPDIVEELCAIKECSGEAVSEDGEERTPFHLAVEALGIFRKQGKAKNASKNSKLEDIKKALLVQNDVVKNHIDVLYRDRTLYVEALNAILVGSALISSITFAGVLQPPLGFVFQSHYLSIDKVEVRLFAVANGLSFFFGMASAIIGATGVLPKPEAYVGTLVKNIQHKLIWASSFLVLSICCVLAAFGAASFAEVPSKLKYRRIMVFYTVCGGAICLLMLYKFLKRIWMIKSQEEPTEAQFKAVHFMKRQFKKALS